MEPSEWTELVARYRQLGEEWESVRGNADARSRCAHETMKLIGAAATRMPSRGALVDVMTKALLESDLESADHLFALAVLVRRKQFPRRFLPAMIGAAVRHGTRGNRIIVAAATAYGSEAVLRGLAELAETSESARSAVDFLSYYVAPRE